jgi:hypothetical protein
MYTEFELENVKGRGHPRDLVVDQRLIFKLYSTCMGVRLLDGVWIG